MNVTIPHCRRWSMYNKFSTINRAAKSKVVNIIYFDKIITLRTLLSHHHKKQLNNSTKHSTTSKANSPSCMQDFPSPFLET